MNKHFALLLVAAAITGCSSTKVSDVGSGDAVPAGTQQAISEQRLSNDFKRQGVRVVYSWSGKLEAIEVTGYAPVWGGSQNAAREAFRVVYSRSGKLEAIEVTGYAPVWGSSQNAAREAFRVAELEAKKSLNDFINKEVITSSTSVTMISRNLEKARDNKTNNFSTNKNRDEVASVAADDDADNKGEINNQQNTAIRNDALTIASRVRNNISIRNQGILGGLYLVEGEVINGGKNVRVVYRWDEKHTKTRQQIRNIMMQ